MGKLYALVKEVEGEERVLAVGPSEALGPVRREDGGRAVPVEDLRFLRPVVLVEDGVVVQVFPGCGEPLVIDLDEHPDTAYYAIGVDDREILEETDSLEEALEIAEEALAEAYWKVDLELRDSAGETLEVFLLYQSGLGLREEVSSEAS